MGNCFTNSNRLEHGRSYIGVDYLTEQQIKYNNHYAVKELRDPFSTEPTENESTGATEFGENATAPLSPDYSTTPSLQVHTPQNLEQYPMSVPLSSYSSTTTATTSSSLPTSPLTTMRLQQDLLDQRLVEEASEATDLVSPLSHCSRPQSRAYQARLQKAQKMQRVLANGRWNTSVSISSCCSSNDSCTGGSRTRWTRSGSVSSIGSNSRCYENTDTALNNNNNNNNAFDNHNNHSDATHVDSTAWAQMSLDGSVQCIAVSWYNNQKSTNQDVMEKKPLYVAVGTDTGTVLVQQVLVDDTNLNLPTTNQNFNENKLGSPVGISLEGRVRSLNFSADGHYLAVGGDNCKCHIFRIDCWNGTTVDGIHDDLSITMDQPPQPKLHTLVWVTEIDRVDRVTSVQFSPDNHYLAIGGYDGAVAIFQTDDMTDEQRLVEPFIQVVRDGLIMTIDWSPDSRYLAIGGLDKCCAIVDRNTPTWDVIREIRKKSTIQALKWSPTGKFLAIGSVDKLFIVQGSDFFSTVNETVLPKGNGSGCSRSNAMCWSPNGSYLAVCGGGLSHTCAVYETKAYTIVHRIAQSGNIRSLVWGPNSSAATDTAVLRVNFLAMGGDDNKVTLMKAGLGMGMSSGSSVTPDDMSASMSSSASYFSSRGDWVLQENTFTDVEDVVDASVVANGVNIAEGVGAATVLAIAFSKGSKSRPSAYFAYSTDDGLVTIRYTTDWKVIAEIQFPKPVPTMAFSTGSKYLALGCYDSNVYVSNTLASWELVAKIEFAAPITALQFGSTKNDRLAVGSIDGTMAFLDPANDFEFSSEVEIMDSPVVTLDWTARNLAIGREDGSVAVYETNDVVKDIYNSVADIQRKASVTGLAFGVNSRFLAVGDAEGFVGIFSSRGGWVLCHQVVCLDRPISSVVWCPLGRYLAFGSEDGQIKVMDTMWWIEVNEATIGIAPTEDRVSVESQLAFSQDGKLLAFSRSDLGFGVKDSTKKWNFVLNMLDDGQESSLGSTSVADKSQSSKSSHDLLDDSCLEDDGDGRYEV